MGLFDDAWDAVSSAAEDGADAVGDVAEDAWDAASDAAEDAWDRVSDTAEDVWEEISETAEDVWEQVSEGAEDVWSQVADGADDVWDDVTDWAEDAWEEAAGFVDGAADRFEASVENAWEALAGAAEDTWEEVTDFAEEAWDKIGTFPEDAWDSIEGAAEDAWDRVAGFAEDAAGAMVALYEDAVEVIERVTLWLGDVVKSIADFILQLGACLAGQVVYALAKADNLVFNIGRPVQTFSQAFIDREEPLFPDFPMWENIWYVDGAHLSANYYSDGTDGMTFGGVTWYGATLTHLIFLRPAFDQARTDSRELAVHELVHVRQYKRFVFERAFACAYGVGYAQAGFDYASNPLEREAYQFVSDHLADI